METSKKVRITIFALALLLLAAGAGTATMHAVTGDSSFCGTCHVMDNYMSSWQHSSHRDVAGCNDCHTDQTNYLTKTWTKATAGARHAYVNYLSTPPQHLKMVESSKGVVQGNCLRCHGQVVEKTTLADPKVGGKYCFDCHRSMPHGRERPGT